MARMEGQLAVCWTLRPHIDLQDVKILALGTLIEEWPAVLCPQRARNEVACCMSGLLAQLDFMSVRNLGHASWQKRLTLLEVQLAMRGPFGPRRSGSAWFMKTVASQEILTSPRGNEPVAIHSLPFPVRTTTWS